MQHCSVAFGVGSNRWRGAQVHAYTAGPQGRTAYLSELQSGHEVSVVNAEGQQRSAIVGRVKIETRPLVMNVPLASLLMLAAQVYRAGLFLPRVRV